MSLHKEMKIPIEFVNNPAVYWEKVDYNQCKSIVVSELFAGGTAIRYTKVPNDGWITWSSLRKNKKIINHKYKLILNIEYLKFKMSFPLKYIQEAIIETKTDIDPFKEIDKLNKLINKTLAETSKNLANENNLDMISNLEQIKFSVEMIKKYLEKNK